MAEKLFTEFPEVSTQTWEEVIIKDLKGADYEKKLVWRTMEGFNVRPYYRSEDLKNLKHVTYAPGQFPFVRGTKKDNNWKIRQDFCAKDVNSANRQALDVLMKGVNSVGFGIDGKKGLSQSDFDALLNNICATAVEINFIGSCCKTPEVVKMFAEKVRTLNPDEIYGSIDYSPLSKLTLYGGFCNSEEKDLDMLKESVIASKSLPHFRTIDVSGYIFHNAGATIVQELAFALAMGNEYLAKLTDRELSAGDIAKKMKFTFAVSSNYFMEIAKFRAARMLWAHIVKAYEGSDKCAQKMYIHARTSAWMQTVYDSYVNMLRGTTEAMSATLAGVDSLEVLPFDTPFEEPSEFSNRIARNVQIILKEESYFDKVVDPAAGSYYVEKLTSLIADEAWKLFKTVEEKGGYTEAFKAGFIQEQVSASAKKHNVNIETRREIILGTNQYPNFNETLTPEVRENINKTCACKCSAENRTAEPIQIYRAAEAFETMRMKTENSGKQPKAFMLTFGNLAMCRARAQFSSNFFACAGIKVIDNNCFANIEEGAKAAWASKAEIVVACSSDEEYADAVPQIANLLGGGIILVVAGAPACENELRAKGITHFISVRNNVLETLKQYQNELGI
ncbi:MAG: acyl-CoA mutase large subunit family protein [Prevotellaceae bacterium]|jgi:methylmalonyl-CoA mutase|nr:acyl-CoA mutase large subunit family protein [Prevotellaceae bacterium]